MKRIKQVVQVLAVASALATLALCISEVSPVEAVAAAPNGHFADTSSVISNAIGPSRSLVGTYNVSVQIDPSGGGTEFKYATGEMTLNSDGTWSGNVLASLGCSESGSWLSSGHVLALSDRDPGGGCDVGYGLTWMVTVKGRKLGSPTAPGYMNGPGQWDAVPAPGLPPVPRKFSKIGLGNGYSLFRTYNASVTLSTGAMATGQLTLNNDGTWSGNVLASMGCSESGSWLRSGKLLRSLISTRAEAATMGSASRGWQWLGRVPASVQPQNLVT